MRPLRALNDESGQILAQVVKIGLIVVALIVIIAEVGPVIYTRITIINDAEDVALGAAFSYKTTESESTAIEDAGYKMKLMGYSDEEIRESTVEFLPAGSRNKETVRVTVVKYANTLITRHIGYLKRFSRVAKTAETSIATATSQTSQ